MLQIDDKIVSFDVIEEYFLCDLSACQGICCVDGDSGAPLKHSELRQVKKCYPKIKKLLPKENIEKIEQNGHYLQDSDGDFVTPCMKSGDCVYLYFDPKDDIYKCGFEVAHAKNEIKFKKPISCHLYPIRLTQYESFIAVNYQKRNICSAARILGKQKKVKVYEFLKEPLIKEFGEEWYEKLDYAAKNYKIIR